MAHCPVRCHAAPARRRCGEARGLAGALDAPRGRARRRAVARADLDRFVDAEEIGLCLWKAADGSGATLALEWGRGEMAGPWLRERDIREAAPSARVVDLDAAVGEPFHAVVVSGEGRGPPSMLFASWEPQRTLFAEPGCVPFAAGVFLASPLAAEPPPARPLDEEVAILAELAGLLDLSGEPLRGSCS